MEIDRIHIKNFRSIKNEVMRFNHNCLVLIGKNEAGKSNVLKAVAAVFDKYKVSDKDKRKRIDNEVIDEFFARAVIKLNPADFKKVIKQFETKYQNSSCIKFKNGKSLTVYIETAFHEFLVNIDIGNDKKSHLTYWNFRNDNFNLLEPLYLSSSNLTTVPPAGAAKFNLEYSVFEIVKDVYLENSYNCNYWQYQDNYLLPSSINIDEFIAKPESIKGLENIFILCKRENIKKEFDDALSQDGDYSNLLEQVSYSVTKTFQKIWKDFKGTAIELRPNGDEINVKVVNQAKYSFEDRSDGFKKFISILLMLSTQSRANKIHERDLILIDEPDQSLYPTSAEYLRDELLEISKKSKVIYSTHSQYMIDSNTINRHIIVEKADDITTLKVGTDNAPFSDDELLKRAVGSSIFECLKSKNIIFEGYLDREIFKKYCMFSKQEKDFKDYGVVYLGGISGAETLVQLLILANKKFLIVADNDEVSNSKRTDFSKNYPEYKECWISYGDINKSIFTMEDFLKPKFIEKLLNENGYPDFKFDEGKNVIQNIEKLTEKNKDKKQQLKNQLIAALEKENIKEDYGVYLHSIREKLLAL